MAINAQGTNLYFIDAENDLVVELGCPTSISGVSGARDQREVTCLEDIARAYEAGMITPGQVSIGLNVDPSDTSHTRAHELYVAGTSTSFAIGWSDGTAAPTIDSDGDFDLPTDRSWLTFDGYFSDFPFDWAIAASVTSTLAIQMSGLPVWTPETT